MKTIKNYKHFENEFKFQPYTNAHRIKIIGYKVLDDVNFISTGEFLKPVTIKGCMFEGFFAFESNHFKDTLVIEDCTFNQFKISASSFQKEVIFKNCTILGKFIIIDSTFHEFVQFHKNNYNLGCNLFERHEPYGVVEFKGGVEFF